MIKTTLHTIQNLFFGHRLSSRLFLLNFKGILLKPMTRCGSASQQFFGIATLKPILSITINIFDSRLVNFLVR